MDIEDFLKDALAQVTRAVNQDGGDATYTIHPAKGIDFDLAVTTVSTESSEKGVSGGLKIKVVGADASKSSSSEVSHQVASRVKFNVLVD